MCRKSAVVNGLFRKSPSAATLPGAVEKAINTPAEVVNSGGASPREEPVERPLKVPNLPASGLSRQASRKISTVFAAEFHLADDTIDVDGLIVDRRAAFELGVDGKDQIAAVHLHAVSRIEQQSDVGSLRGIEIFAQPGVERRFISVDSLGYLKSKFPQRGGHVVCVVGRDS